jgi:hypothetical protein
MRFFRVQNEDRDVTELLDPECQFSHAYSGEKNLTRQGVSTCESLDELAEYLVCGMAGALESGARSGHWVLIELEATETCPNPVDEYEVLVRPTAIVSVTKIFDTDLIALMDAKIEFFDSFTTHDWDDEDDEDAA